MNTYAIVYLRPDGWWEAGRGWTNRQKAQKALKGIQHTRSRVVRVDELDSVLCDEAKAELCDSEGLM